MWQPVRLRDELVQLVNRARLSAWDGVYALDMAMACFISYWLMTHILSGVVAKDSDLLGGMWAVVATIFVFGETRARSTVGPGVAGN